MRFFLILLLALSFPPAALAQEDPGLEVVTPSAEDIQKMEEAAKKEATAATEIREKSPGETDEKPEGGTEMPPGQEKGAESAPAELPPLAEMPSAPMEDMQIAVLRTIDKVSARTHTFDIPVGKTVKFGNSLFIKARACRKSSPIALPESAAFLQIWERKPHQKESSWVFSGWMFASSPSLSAMTHPVYDVWVISCKNKSTSEKQESFSSESEPVQSPEDDKKSPAKQGDEKTSDEAAKPAAEPVDTGD